MLNLYTKANDFAINNILPFAETVDKEARFPKESFDKIAEEGYLKVLIPSEYGGDGGTLEDHADVCRAFAKHSATVGLCYMMHNVALMAILVHGSEQMKEKVFKEVVNDKKLLALAYSELGTGTHFYISDVKTIVEDDKVTFNGLKSMVTSGGFADYYLVLAPSEKEGAIDNWLFPKEVEGLSFLPNTWDGLGMRGNVSCRMPIEDVTLTKDYIIGEIGSGQEQVFNVVAPFFVTGLGAVYSGVSEAILEEAVKHTTTRKYPQAGTLSEIETVQIHLAKIYTKTNAAVLSVKEAARSGANGEVDALAKILSARIFASEAAIELGTIGMRLGGGKAYNKVGPMERLLRDSLASHIMAPSVDVLTIWLGRAITGQDLV